jgi:serine protease AprX
MRKMRLFIPVILVPVLVQARHTRHLIRFTDKSNNPYTIDKPSPYVSAKAIERRNRQKIPIDSSNLPVSPAYLDSRNQAISNAANNVSAFS